MDISPSQLRAARALVGITSRELAAASGVHLSTLSRIEGGGDAYGSTLRKLRNALEVAGVVFIASGELAPSAGAGVRLRD